MMRADGDDRAVVHVVDDDELMRTAMTNLFESIGLAAQTYPTASDFLRVELKNTPGCIVTDVRMPDMSGLEFQTKLRQLGVTLPVIVMTGYGDVPMSVRAMKGGAVDFLPKPFRDQDMIDAVTAAIERDRVRRAADGPVAELRERFAMLSARERQVMLLVSSGKMNKQVAGELAVSEVTVKIHRGSAMRKMGARTLADLVRMADVLKANRC